MFFSIIIPPPNILDPSATSSPAPNSELPLPLPYRHPTLTVVPESSVTKVAPSAETASNPNDSVLATILRTTTTTTRTLIQSPHRSSSNQIPTSTTLPLPRSHPRKPSITIPAALQRIITHPSRCPHLTKNLISPSRQICCPL